MLGLLAGPCQVWVSRWQQAWPLGDLADEMTGSEQEQEGRAGVRAQGAVHTCLEGTLLHISVCVCVPVCVVVCFVVCSCSFLWACVSVTHWVLSRVLKGVPV